MRNFLSIYCGIHSALLLLAVFPAEARGEGPPSRIVTIGGAATEIVYALGAGDSVVAVDLSSTHPPEVRDLPQVGYVRQISPEGVLSMEPDWIISTGALGPPAAREMMEEVRVPVTWLPDLTEVEDLRQSVRKVAERLGESKKAEDLLKKIEGQLAEARRRAERKLEPAPSVLFLLEPPAASTGGMAAGRNSRAATLIELAGGRNAAQDFAGFQPISRESLPALDPDVILIGRSNGHGGSEQSLKALRNAKAMSGLKAVRNNAVHGVPLDDLAFGPRLGEAVLRWNKKFLEWKQSTQP